jgi:hypothetical protein
MRLPRTLKPGTRVTCNVKGRVFTATVVERTPTGVRVQPPKGITWREIKARDVKSVHAFDPYATQVTTEGASA